MTGFVLILHQRNIAILTYSCYSPVNTTIIIIIHRRWSYEGKQEERQCSCAAVNCDSFREELEIFLLHFIIGREMAGDNQNEGIYGFN